MTANSASARSALIAAAIAVIIHGLLGLALLFGMLWIVPEYKREYRDYQVSLPQFTVTVVAVSDWFVSYWFVVAVTALPLLALDGAVVFWCWRRKETRFLGVLWIVVLVFCWLFSAGLAAFGLWLAHLKLQEGLAR